MATGKKPTDRQVLRLEKIAKHLRVKSRWSDESFAVDVRRVCLKAVRHVLAKTMPEKGEGVCEALAVHYRVKFEEVHWQGDVRRLKDEYMGRGEIGFAQLDELSDSNVDALLFRRMLAKPDDEDAHVAVLNLQTGEKRGYWSRFHELTHRIAEPQRVLPFRRHRFEVKNPVERLIDDVTGYLAFYQPILRPLVLSMAARFEHLTIGILEEIQDTYAPTASLQSTMNAVVREWPRAAVALTAEMRGRKNAPKRDVALRVSPQHGNREARRQGLFVYPNMRVPVTSPIYDSLMTKYADGPDDLCKWTTSGGSSLSGVVYSSVIQLGEVAYAIISA